MEWIFGHLGTVVLAILALGVLIIVHEGGHFLAARLSGMRVDRFSIGFGPTLVSFKRGETIYQIAAVPLGGFVQIAGLTPGDESLAADDPRAYPNRPAWQRFATIFAGPGTNYVFAAVVMVFLYGVWGVPVEGKMPVVAAVTAGRPAAVAGLKEEDQIVRIGDREVKDYGEVSRLINATQGAPTAITVVREGKPLTVTVKPEKDGSDYRVGIQLGAVTDWEPASFGTRIQRALVFPIQYSGFILHGLGEIITGKQKAQFSGPIGIVKVMEKQIASGPRFAFNIVALISIYLGLFNLLPLPALDGGRLVFLSWELISRRRVNQKFETAVHTLGLVVLLTFILIISVKNDLGLGRLFHR